jgi:hypothetical protein
MACSILRRFPDLCSEPETWVKLLLESPNIDYDGRINLLIFFAPANIKANRKLMLRACRFDMVIAYVDDSLRHDLTFLVSVLDCYPFQLAHLDEDVRLMFPDLILSYLGLFLKAALHPSYEQSITYFLAGNLSSSFWRDRRNIEAWFLAGLPHPHTIVSEDLSREWNEDADLMLLIASHVHHKFQTGSFFCVSLTLRSDKSFMKKAIILDPFLFFCTSDTLQQDFDLRLIAFGSSVEVYNKFAGQPVPAHFQESLLTSVEAKLSVHHAFSHLFLVGMEQPQYILSLLNNGWETSLSFKKAIAEYLGVPIGRELHLLRSCAKLRNHTSMSTYR